MVLGLWEIACGGEWEDVKGGGDIWWFEDLRIKKGGYVGEWVKVEKEIKEEIEKGMKWNEGERVIDGMKEKIKK